MPPHVQVFTFGFLLAVGGSVLVHGQSIRIDAAATNNGHVFLFSGNQFAVLRDKQQLYSLKSRSTTFLLPDDFQLESVYVDSNANVVRFYGPDYSGSLDLAKLFIPGSITFRKTKDAGFPFQNAPDAVVSNKMGNTYFAKGCDLFLKDSSSSSPKKITIPGLPCDIDASWEEKGWPVVLKGDQFWRLTADGVEGPFDFGGTYRLWTWKLRPAC